MDANNLEPPVAADEHLSRAFALREADEPDKALVACDAAIQIGRAFLADAYNLRGIVLKELGQSDEAIVAYETALEMRPEFEDAADNLRELEAELGISRVPITVATFGGAEEAHLAQARLKAEGIPAFLPDEYGPGTLGLGKISGVRLQVYESDLPAAQEILGIEEEEGVRCPRCGSWEVRLPFLGNEWQCKNCGHEWTM